MVRDMWCVKVYQTLLILSMSHHLPSCSIIIAWPRLILGNATTLPVTCSRVGPWCRHSFAADPLGSYMELRVGGLVGAWGRHGTLEGTAESGTSVATGGMVRLPQTYSGCHLHRALHKIKRLNEPHFQGVIIIFQCSLQAGFPNFGTSQRIRGVPPKLPPFFTAGLGVGGLVCATQSEGRRGGCQMRQMTGGGGVSMYRGRQYVVCVPMVQSVDVIFAWRLGIPLQYHRVVSSQAPGNASNSSGLSELSTVSIDTVLFVGRCCSNATAVQYLGEDVVSLCCPSLSRPKGASGTTDEDFVLLSLRTCLSQRATHKTLETCIMHWAPCKSSGLARPATVTAHLIRIMPIAATLH